MASLSLLTRPEEARLGRIAADAEVAMRTTTIVGAFGDGLVADYTDYARLHGGSAVTVMDLDRSHGLEIIDDAIVASSVVLFLQPKLNDMQRLAAERLLSQARDAGARSACIVNSFRAHLGDAHAAASEAHLKGVARRLDLRTTVIRHGHVISARSPVVSALRRWSALYPLVPSGLRSCFVSGSALFSAIEQERTGHRTRRPRTHTLLGPNLSWRDMLANHWRPGPLWWAIVILSSLFSLLLVGQIAAFAITLLARRRTSLRHWHVHTLRPQTFRELRALCSPYGHRDVKVVGYNNGVHHFGHRFPLRTVVSTVHLNRVLSHGRDCVRADCGATIRKARDFIRAQDRDLFVVPNYSYVCMGTAFFVPIHGSASDYSCIAETITRAVLYDPARDRLILADRGDAAFGRYVYDTNADVVLLRLYCRVKPRGNFFLQTQEAIAPTAAELLDALRDQRAANVEVRKASTRPDGPVRIHRFYPHASDAAAALEVPRDSIGRLWDRLEENPITSFLMHALTRRLAFHVELFFTPPQFEQFWATHVGLPVKKIQLRHIRRDYLPNSPFRDQACVSADMFMFRRHRERFERYLKDTFDGTVRTNPGKHSR
jgi:hypothetical protein